MDKFIDELNKRQQDAVKKLEGPVLVIAGAGSGKTKTLTYRIAYLIKDKNINPLNILAVTFTNKAANEMKERIYKLIGETYIPFMGTFHSLCVKFLRRDGANIGIAHSFNIYDTNDSLEAIKDSMKALNISPKEFNPHKIHNLISSCKSELIAPNEYAQYAKMPLQETTAQIYPLYEKILKDCNALDFDDLIMKTVQLFSHKEILEKYQAQFKYVLVDEYQDTNHAQYMLVKMLSAKYRNIYCVGDPDQSIYAFRGATIGNILNFENDYPDCKVVKLEQNYRSTKNILKAAHHVISKNTNRKDKEMWTENYEGEKVKRYIANSEKDEAYFIAQKVKDKGDFSKCVVLYRTNSQSRAIEEVFLEERIPYKLVGGLKFYDRREIKDIISYLKILNNIKDNITLKRIINVPARGIGKKTLDDISDYSERDNISIMEYLFIYKDTINVNLKKFTLNIEYLISLIPMNEVTLSHFINIIIEKIDYISYLEEDDNAEARVENIKELNSVASRYDNQDLKSALDDFLEGVSLLEQETSLEETNNTVTLMSVHSAKGLEFDTVFIVGMEEGLFPHSNSFYNPEDLEEERRLCYVGMTRAKKELYLINAESRVLYGSVQSNRLSRFLKDIPDSLTKHVEKYSGYNSNDSYYSQSEVENNFKKGDYVFHPTFREGIVIDSYNDSIIVTFNTYGTKKLLLAYATGLKKIDYDNAGM